MLFSPAAIQTLGYIALWYLFSIGLTFYNKWLFKVRAAGVEGGKGALLAAAEGRRSEGAKDSELGPTMV